jgi:hypothetical protein
LGRDGELRGNKAIARSTGGWRQCYGMTRTQYLPEDPEQ